MAAFKGHLQVALALLQAGADLGVRDYRVSCAFMRVYACDRRCAVQGYTALHNAAIGGHPQMLLALVQAGADPNARDQWVVVNTAPCVTDVCTGQHRTASGSL